ncbi:MAG: hypothetical protein EU543_02180 [Promethearchaeota archaeon]|nr:MAG: hypothetical protein EU543_02180 [Candidatus Lokiarchaeota archaeon]
MSPTTYFDDIFSKSGFIQNAWHRFLIGSSSPTLEISQISRGLWEATEKLNFSQKCILRTWAFRNAVRLKPNLYKISKEKLEKFNTLIATSIEKEIKNELEVNISYIVKLRSYSITQLIFLTEIIKNIFNEVHKKYPTYNQGTLFLKSYHTTTSLITNEHEYGNYLDLHFRFAEISRKDSSNYFHTVRALENRADFNRFDHDLATDFGNRQLILPISKGKLVIGNRENFYILVTFGPRTIQLNLNIRLLK